ncbi:MAG: guanylate kinase [Acidimicrobiales bacterium]|nr:guanylate kinase [Acidimicrobiales bacterium]
MIVVVCGPGGVGKGTVVSRLVAEDPSLWVSRSWTTRPPRPGEDPEAYRFVDRATFLAHVDAGGFLEHAEFLGHLYGTPWPDADREGDVILEIEVQGAAQVLERDPTALVVLLEPPSAEEQAARLRGRGDTEEAIAERVAVGAGEMEEGRRLGGVRIVNDDLAATVEAVRGVIVDARARRARS